MVNKEDISYPDGYIEYRNAQVRRKVTFGVGSIALSSILGYLIYKTVEARAGNFEGRHDIIFTWSQLQGTQPIRGELVQVRDVFIEINWNGAGFERHDGPINWSDPRGIANPGVRADMEAKHNEKLAKIPQQPSELSDSPHEWQPDPFAAENGAKKWVPIDPLKRFAILQMNAIPLDAIATRLVIVGNQTTYQNGELVVLDKETRIEINRWKMDPDDRNVGIQIPVDQY